MRSVADAVVIGAGALGASVAYHLAVLGKRVSLVDRDDFASQTSPRAAGQTQQVRFDRATTELAKESVRKILRFTAETGEPLTYHQSGGVKLAHEPHWAAQIHDEVERGHAYGVEIELITVEEARRLAPWFVPDGALAIWYAPTDLYLEPRELPLGYARAAGRLGAELLPRTTVTGLRTRAGRVEAVVTDSGEIATEAVVDAAGAWAGVVAAMTGIRVPIVPTRHQLYITKPLAGVRPEHPIVRLLRDGSVYVRPERGGLLFGGYEPDPVAVDVEALPREFRIADLPLDIAPLRRLTEEVREQFPILQDAEIAELRGGLPTMTADGHHIFDEVPGVRGFLIATGCCVGALSISPAVGEVFARWVVDGSPPVDMSWFRLARFGAELESRDRLRQACLWRYAHHYETPEHAAG